MNPFSDAARWFSATQVLDRRRRDPRRSRGKRSGRSRAFAAMLEPLEDRTVLNVTVTGAATNTITFTSTSASDNLYLQTSGGVLEYNTDGSNNYTSTNFNVGANQKIIVSESGGTLNLQNLDTQGGNLEIDNDVTVTGSLNTEGGAVNINGGTVTVNANLTTLGDALSITGSSITVDNGSSSQPITISTSSGSGSAGLSRSRLPRSRSALTTNSWQKEAAPAVMAPSP